MRTFIHFVFFVLLFFFCAFLPLPAQNEDTPNLSFEQGTFAGWTLYKGQYYYDDNSPGAPAGVITGSNTYKYIWTETAPAAAGEQFRIMSTMGQSDPTIACSNFLINPDGRLVARIGVPTATEGLDKLTPMQQNNCNTRNQWNTGKYATAERMTYTFTVTPRTTLFTYKFAAVLHVPDNDSHSGEQLPFFSVSASLYDPVTNTSPVLPCAGYSVNADMQASGLIRNKTYAECQSARTRGNSPPDEYVYRDWTTGSFDLSNHIGKTVTIEIVTHDCLVNCNAASVSAGGHDAWGYFWAETRELKLGVQNCVGEDAVITAPEGFTTYTWRRSDNRPVDILNGNQRTASIPQSQMSPGVTYYCEMQGDMNNCSPIILSTELLPVQIKPAFSYNPEFCAGKVAFTDSTTISEDTIRSYSWDFGNGFISNEKNPVHEYAQSGQYQVTLRVTSGQGCESTTTKPVTVRYFPTLDIDGNEMVCYGDEFVLSVFNTEVGSQFLWSNGSTQQSMIDVAETSQYYSVTVTDRYHCKYTKDIYVSVQPVPVLLITGDKEVCLNDTVTWRAVGADSYIWNNGATTAETKIRPLTDEVISVTGKLANGCTATLDTLVKVNPVPDVAIIGPDSICRNETVLYTATGASSYAWGDLFLGANRNVSPRNDTIFTVTGVDAKGCKSTFSKSIKVKDIPILSYIGKDSVCAGVPLTILAQGAVTYAWQDGSSENVYMTIPTNWGDVVYSVTGSTNGCSVKLDIPVHVLPVPSVWIEGMNRMCFGDSITLTAQGAGHYVWNTGETTGGIVVSPSSSSSFQVQGFGANGCTSVVSRDITVYPKPKILITGDKSVCENTYTTLTAQGGITYEWSNGIIASSITPLIGVGDFTFTVTGTDNNFCRDTATFTVSSVPLPGLSFTGSPEVCLGETLTLIGQGATSYKWSDGSNSPVYTATPTTSGIVTMTGTVANCTSSLDIPVSILIPPTLYISGDSAVCKGTEFTLWANGADSYEWDTGDNTASISYRLDENTTYRVTGKDEASGCESRVNTEVKLLPFPDIKIKLEDIFSCPEQPDTVVLIASGGVKYQWSSIPYNGGINERASERLRFEIEENTQVFVEGESQYGCFASDTFLVKRLEHPTFVFSIEPNVVEKGSTAVRFKGVSPDNYQWYWTVGERGVEKEGNNVTHSFSTFEMETDSILVTVRNINDLGCQYKGEEWVYVWRDFWAPDAFSPNGDKLNDSFRFQAEDYIYQFSYIIFNRLGEVIFTGESSADEWDGTYNGQPCPWGVYGWLVNYKSDYKGVRKKGEKKGFVTLVR